MKRSGLVYIVVGDPHFTFENSNSAVVLYLKTIAAELQKHGRQVKLYPNSFSAPKSNAVKKNWLIGKLKRFAKFLFKGFYLKRLFNTKVEFSEKLYHEIISEAAEPSCVIEFLTTGSTIGFKLSSYYKVPLVVIYDSPLAEQFSEIYGNSKRVNSEIESCELMALKRADTIICYSYAVSKYINDKVSVHSNIEVIPCIVWKESCEDNTSGKNIVIGFIGSFLKWHKVDLLLRAFELLADQHAEVLLVLVGHGEEWEKLQMMCQSSRHSERILLTGFVDDKELKRLKSTFDVGVMPGSNWYGSPLKIFEYAESGIAVVSAKSPTIQELFNNDEILFIDENNPEKSLFEHLKLLTDNRDFRVEMGIKVKNKMNDSYSKTSVMNNFIRIIEKNSKL